MRNVIATRESLNGVIDRFIENNSSYRHLLLLADSGMGKTSFFLNYYVRNQSKRKKRRIALVPLGIPNAVTYIREIEDKKSTVLFLDALDEDVKAIEDHKKRVSELMAECSLFNKVIISCRTHFFSADEEITSDTGVIKIGALKAGERKTYDFWKIYLAPFSDKQVDTFINRRYSIILFIRRQQAKDLAGKIPLLNIRPMLLAFIPDLIDQAWDIEYSCDLYETLIEAWYIRESYWVEIDKLRAFSERLAVDLYVNRTIRGAERIHHSELETLAQDWKIDLKDWQIRSRSLLNRDTLGNYKFSHRSVLEYLFIKNLVNDPSLAINTKLTPQMQTFLLEMHQLKVSDVDYLVDRDKYYNLREFVTLIGIENFRHTYQLDASHQKSTGNKKIEPSNVYVMLKGVLTGKNNVYYERIILPKLVYIPAGTFISGAARLNDVHGINKVSIAVDSDLSYLPQRLIFIPHYRISRHPVTYNEYYSFVKETSALAPEHMRDFDFIKQFGNHPVTGITPEMANGYCEWLSKATDKSISLPNEFQWEKATRGLDGRLYPWGNKWNADAYDNISKPHDVGMHSPEYRSPYNLFDAIFNTRELCVEISESIQYNNRNAIIFNPELDLESRNNDKYITRGGKLIDPPHLNYLVLRKRFSFSENNADLGFRIVQYK